jgi:hypothetical protein
LIESTEAPTPPSKQSRTTEFSVVLLEILSQEITCPAIFSEGEEHPASSNTATAIATLFIENPYPS